MKKKEKGEGRKEGEVMSRGTCNGVSGLRPYHPEHAQSSLQWSTRRNPNYSSVVTSDLRVKSTKLLRHLSKDSFTSDETGSKYFHKLKCEAGGASQ